MIMNESAENYLETILVLNHRLGNVRSIDIANEMNFKKPSVSVAMKNLRENGYITVSPEGYIHLTDSGLEVAERIYERHTTLSSWLIMLGVDPRVAAEDACKIEHDVSAESFEAIKRHIRSVARFFTLHKKEPGCKRKTDHSSLQHGSFLRYSNPWI